MAMRILVLNGPNLDRLGSREPEVYGASTLAEIIGSMRAALAAGETLDHVQSADESELVRAVHSASASHDVIVVNPGAFTHYSWALHDALKTFAGPVIEVHLSNPQAREPFRHGSVVASVASGTISGFGPDGYTMAVAAARTILGRR